MKKGFLIVAVALITLSINAQNWNLDKSHAKLGFSVTHLLISDVEGSFKTFDIKLTSSKEDFTDAVIELTADINSINTDNAGRDKHLKAADFFDAEKYPTLTFKSSSLKKVEGKKYKLTGNLTMHGVTKPVSLDVIFNGVIPHPYNKKSVAGFKITGTLNRLDYGVGPTQEAVVGNEITIDANAEFIKE